MKKQAILLFSTLMCMFAFMSCSNEQPVHLEMAPRGNRPDENIDLSARIILIVKDNYFNKKVANIKIKQLFCNRRCCVFYGGIITGVI